MDLAGNPIADAPTGCDFFLCFQGITSSPENDDIPLAKQFGGEEEFAKRSAPSVSECKVTAPEVGRLPRQGADARTRKTSDVPRGVFQQ